MIFIDPVTRRPTEENDATTRLKDLFQKILRLGCVGRSVATTDASILHAVENSIELGITHMESIVLTVE